MQEAVEEQPNWKTTEADLREAGKQVTFAFISETDDINRVTATVDELLTLLQRGKRG